MAFTLEQAQQHVYRDVKGGTFAPDDQLVTDQINRATIGLLTSQYAVGEFSEWIVKLQGDRRSLLLPPDIEVAEMLSLNGLDGRGPIKVRMKWYRYLRDRCPFESLSKLAPVEADDLGDGHVVESMPDGEWNLMAYSERPHDAPAEPNDVGERLYIRGIGEDGKPVFTQEKDGVVEGAYLDIRADAPTVTKYEGINAKFKQITHISKPETRWPITIAAVDCSKTETGCTPQINFQPLVTALPWETSVSRRLYRLDQEAPEGCDYVHVFGRARYRPARHKTDILLIQNLEALRQGVLRLEAEDEGDVSKIRHFDQASRSHLDEGLKRNNGNNQEPAEYSWEPGATIGGGLTNL